MDTDNSEVMVRGKGGGAGWRRVKWAMGRDVSDSVTNKNKVKKTYTLELRAGLTSSSTVSLT